MKEAPLYNDCVQLARWLAQALPGDDVVSRRTVQSGVELLEHTALAFGGFDRPIALEDADRAAARLRAGLRLCRELGHISDDALLHGAALLDGVGRQIGGWQRSLREGRA